MKDHRGCNYASLEMYYPQNAFPEALRLIADSVASEREDELFYDFLLGQAPSREEAAIIASIRDDERKHVRLFRQLYCQLTCEDLPPNMNGQFNRPADYCAGIKQALFGELGAVEKYRRILFGLSYCLPYANVVIEIYTDELKHASKWNYLYSRNRCSS